MPIVNKKVGYVILGTKSDSTGIEIKYAAEDQGSGGYIYFTEYFSSAKIFLNKELAKKFFDFWKDRNAYLHGHSLSIRSVLLSGNPQ